MCTGVEISMAAINLDQPLLIEISVRAERACSAQNVSEGCAWILHKRVCKTQAYTCSRQPPRWANNNGNHCMEAAADA